MPRRSARRESLEALPAVGRETDCELCLRPVARYTVHHLVPRAKGGNHGPKAVMCPTCHRQVHALFSEATLAKELNSIPLLQANPRVRQYLDWVRKQDGGAILRVRRANQRG
ncbi:MAG: HNH endonuclease [SAR202 cluster bacterium]|nr:HNH endonuclease [SAR202 cluster bacterium]